MKNLLMFLAGKKSYIIGLLMIALGILNGDNQMLLEGLAIMSLRAGISKSSPATN